MIITAQLPSVQAPAQTAPAAPHISRRNALAHVAGALSLALTGSAVAKTAVPFQESIIRGGSSTKASADGYAMEGTKKYGLTPGKRRAFLEKFREDVAGKASKAENVVESKAKGVLGGNLLGK